MSSNHTTLDAAASDRKARLAKLAALKRKQPEPEESTDPGSNDKAAEEVAIDVTKTYLSGRNYDVETRGPKLGFEQAPTSGQITLEEQAAEIASRAAEQAQQDAETDQPIDLFKLQPKKPNWDLKRDLDEKMEILNVRTQNAIARLVRQRIENAQRVAKAGPNGDGQGENVGIEGEMLVEGIHVREREEEEEREKEDEDLA